MDIKTKYEIGQRVWYVYEDKQGANVADDVIIEIIITENRNSLWFKRML